MGSSSFIEEVGRFELLPLKIQLAKAATPGMVAAAAGWQAETRLRLSLIMSGHARSGTPLHAAATRA